MVALQTVEIPGYREAVKKERQLRDAAFLDGNEILMGVEVVPLSLRRLILMEQAHCGFVCPWKWDSDAEIISHAIMVLFYCSPDYLAPKSPRFSFLRAWRDNARFHRLSRSILGKYTPAQLVDEIGGWLGDAFMDAPTGNADAVASQSHASYPAYIFDLFGAAGLTHTPDQILDMPLKRLWQHMRIASVRIHEAKLNNPSDQIAVDHIAKVGAK